MPKLLTPQENTVRKCFLKKNKKRRNVSVILLPNLITNFTLYTQNRANTFFTYSDTFLVFQYDAAHVENTFVIFHHGENQSFIINR